MRATELIARKRDHGELTADEIAFLVAGHMAGTVPDYQMSAFLMAVVLNGMTDAETTALTACMLRSGATLDLSGLGRPVADKHSTGGVGDKTSLVVASIAAEAGLTVPMISGRALGHTGGTLDKLESIPGFRTALSLDEFRAVLGDLGAAFIGQTREIAPADRKLYALRDATSTVPSVALITASILSKKLAEGLDALVLDVKFGTGAFMKTEARARELASAMCAAAAAHGTEVEALLTRMDEPLGCAVGNAAEVRECVDVLRGAGPEDLTSLSVELAARMILLAGMAAELEEARNRARDILGCGAALERFRRIVERQGGDPRVVDDPSRMPLAPVELAVPASRSGFLRAVDVEEVGWAVMGLGAGRSVAAAHVDPRVGLTMSARIGDDVRAGEELCRVYARDDASAAAAAARVGAAFEIGDAPPARKPLVAGVVGESAHA